jgi:hypothetical protein
MRHRLTETGLQRQRDRDLLTLQIDLDLRPQVPARRAEMHHVPAGLQDEPVRADVPVLQVATVEMDLQVRGLPRVQRHRPEAREGARNPDLRGIGHGDIRLHHFPAGPLPGVRHRQAHRDAVTVVVGLRERLRVRERRVGQAVTEREGDAQLPGVVPPVADEQPLAVADMPVLTGEVQVGGIVGETGRHGLAQLAGRVHRAGEDIGQCCSTALPQQVAVQDRRRRPLHLAEFQRATVGEHDDDPLLHRPHRAQQRQLLGRQLDGRPVETLRFLVLRQAEEEHGDIGIGGVLHRLGEQCRIPARAVGGESRGVGDRGAEPLAQLLQRTVDLGGVDVGTPAALIAGCFREGTDDRHRASHPRVRDGQDVAAVGRIVLQ